MTVHTIPQITIVDPGRLPEEDFFAIAEILHQETGIFLTKSKLPLMQSRLSKRIRALGLSGFKAYRKLLTLNPNGEELPQLISAMTTNFTRFFREKEHFDLLREKIFPNLIDRAKAGGRVRLWSAGCSMGEEAFSLAITLLDLCPQAADLNIRILATDIDPKVLNTGMAGLYPIQRLTGISSSDQERFFTQSTKNTDMFLVAEPARKMVTFRHLNLLKDWPFQGTFDVILCRNVVIYFDVTTQEKLWSRFAQKMNPGGWLLVGHSERVSGVAMKRFSRSATTSYRLE